MPAKRKTHSIPKLEPGWKNGAMMRDAHGGDLEVWNERIAKLREMMISEVMSSVADMPREEAEAVVTRKHVGLRQPRSVGGIPAMAVSPLMQERLLDALYPKIEPGWKTGVMMAKEHGGNHSLWTDRMLDLADELAADIKEQQEVTMKEAHKLLDHNLIGMRRPKSGVPTVAISPEAERLLLERLLPALAPGWKTPHMMEKDYGRDHGKWRALMLREREVLTEDIKAQQDVSKEGAEQLVDHHLLGNRRPKSGVDTIAASEDGARRLLDKYPVKPNRRRTRNGNGKQEEGPSR